MKSTTDHHLAKRIQNWLFHSIHTNNLVYNTCWEDPRCDRELLELDHNSQIVMITSAGCNALAYLLDQPQKIYAVDMNPRQNALLELKKAFFKADVPEVLYECFGQGSSNNILTVYQQSLRTQLPLYAQKFWDKRIKWFNGKGLRKSFYFHGTSGLLAWSVRGYLKLKKQLYREIERFFQATSLEQQALIYQQIDQQFWTRLFSWIMNRHLVMSLAGVPKSQQQLFMTKYENGTVDFLKYCMSNVFTNLPAHENYFWQLYFNGSYSENCCPEYLKRSSFSNIRQQVEKLETHTTTISHFLKENPAPYSHYILLDHQDWLAENNIDELREEWLLILKNSKKGTRILLRSAAEEIDFFPDFVLEQVHFDRETANRVHLKDRVGTYASTYLGIVK